MEIRADARIPFAREVVFAAYRDEITSLLPYLPNVRSIEIKSRKEEGSVVEFVNEWRGGGDIPAAIRAVLSEAVLAWTDYATWRSDAMECDWRTATHAFTDAVTCKGTNNFLADGDGKTLLEIRGSLEIDAKKIRGVPSFLAGKIGRAVEEFLVSKIQSNLVETTKGLEKYLEDKRAKG
jgi:hypothetical protein